MSAQVITPELCEWINEQTRLGHPLDTVFAAMLGSGWDESVARQALLQTLGKAPGATGAAQATPPLQNTPKTAPQTVLQGEPQAASLNLPEPDLSRATPVLWAGDRPVKLLMSIKQPRVIVFGSLLTDEECEGIVSLAGARLSRSETVATASDGTEINASRTSDGMFFERGENELIRRVEARLAALLRWPLEHGEGLQVLRYRPGAEYQPHYDYFDPAHVSAPAILKRGGQRVGTIVMYLNTPTGGGATIFPDIGLDVAPVKGNAVFFSYDRPHPSTQTLHGGAPVIEGEKWVATKWLRRGVFV